MSTLRGRIWDRDSRPTARGAGAGARARRATSSPRPTRCTRSGPGEPFFYADGALRGRTCRAGRPTSRRARHRVPAAPAHRRRAAPRRGRRRPAARALDPPGRARLVRRQHPRPLRREGDAAARPAAARPARRGPAGLHRQRAASAASSPTPRTPSRSAATRSPRPSTSSTSARRAATTRSRGGSATATSCSINIEQLVEPMSRGVLVDDASPDYPPLIDACDDARAQGGVVLWCHNANGMEAPVAAALGRLDGHQPVRPVLDGPRVRRLVPAAQLRHAAAGLDRVGLVRLLQQPRLRATSAGDVLVRALAERRCGRAARSSPTARCCGCSVAGHAPEQRRAGPRGADRDASRWSSSGRARSRSTASRSSRDGAVVRTPRERRRRRSIGPLTRPVDARGGRLGRRPLLGPRAATSYGHPLWAHTSPVYLRERPPGRRARRAAGVHRPTIDRARDWIATRARFDDDRPARPPAAALRRRAAATTSLP